MVKAFALLLNNQHRSTSFEGYHTTQEHWILLLEHLLGSAWSNRIWVVEGVTSVAPMADEVLLGKVHELSDLELAVLICLIAQEHCIIDTDPDVLDELVQELELVGRKMCCYCGSSLNLIRSQQKSLAFPML